MMVFYWNVVEKAQVASYRDTMEGHRAQQSCSLSLWAGFTWLEQQQCIAGGCGCCDNY